MASPGPAQSLPCWQNEDLRLSGRGSMLWGSAPRGHVSHGTFGNVRAQFGLLQLEGEENDRLGIDKGQG